MSSLTDGPVKIRFFPPADELKPYISTLYLTEIDDPDGQPVTDFLHPEWSNIRFVQGGPLEAAIGSQTRSIMPNIIAAGPTSYATCFSTAQMRTWGIGILPLGWTKFLDASADQYADRFVDGADDPAFANFVPLYEILISNRKKDACEEANIINSFICDLLAQSPKDNLLVQRAHSALSDPELSTISALAEILDISARSVERLSKRAFGFPPKLLLRRQRFLRTLAKVMLDPSMRWIASLDDQYHDQAHFARDFKRFMGMSASEYKKIPHPIMGAAVFGRMASAGAAMQALHKID